VETNIKAIRLSHLKTMNIYRECYKRWNPWRTGDDYGIYIRFSDRVDPMELAKSLNRKIKDFGSDKYNSRSMFFVFKKQSKNFMLEMKRLLLKDPDIKEVTIRQWKNENEN